MECWFCRGSAKTIGYGFATCSMVACEEEARTATHSRITQENADRLSRILEWSGEPHGR